MGKAAARRVSARLIAAGLPPATPVVLVENASLPDERHFATRLDLLPLAARTALGEGPAVILIGQAVADAGKALASTAKRVLPAD
jgi:uroporphyrin-III C-methyltransferase